METLTLFGLCFIGTLIVPGQPEVSAMYYTGQLGWNPLAVALVGASAQCSCYAGLYLGGEQLFRRWRLLRRPVEKVRERFESQLEHNFLGLGFLSGSVGVPPALGIAMLGPGFKIPFGRLMGVLFVARFARLTLIALFGKQIAAWWESFSF